MNRSKMHAHRPNRWSSRLAFSTLLVMGWMGTAIAGPTDRAARSADAWTNTLKFVQEGEFQKAEANVDQLGAYGPYGAKMAEWLRELHEMERQRREMTEADYKKYVEWSKEWHAKGKVREALGYAIRAMNNTDDMDAFRSSDWLQSLYNDSLSEANKLRTDKEWLDAHAIYYELSEIFEHDKELMRLRRECLTHARLEVTYKPDGKWQEYLEGIVDRMVVDAFGKINDYYVTEADFAAMTVAGLEQLIVLANSPTMVEVFPSLAKDYRRVFVDRLKKRLEQVQRADRLSHRDALNIFRIALNINRQTIQLPEQLIVSEYMNGALDELDDFSTIIWPVEFREFDKHTQGDFIGVGISISKINGQIVVATPLEDAPAYRAGIMADDVIEKVDGQSTEEMSLTQAVETITGPIDTTVTLTIRRPSTEEVFDVPLKRQKVVIQSVKGFERNADDPEHWNFMIDPDLGIGYMRIGAFQKNTVEHMYSVIDELRVKQGLKGLILDLRFNPGGLLQAAVGMSELFLNEGDRVVSTNGDRTEEWPIDARMTGPFVDLPIVVLINGSSASASEIVSGALKDHHRATIIGERTYGKFSVQNLMRLAHTEAHLKLTTAAYFLPSGKSLHRTDDAVEWGVSPDIDVEVVPKEMIKILTMRRDADVLGPRGSDLVAAAGDVDADTPEALAGETDTAKQDGETAETDADAADGKPADDDAVEGDAEKSEAADGEAADDKEEESDPLPEDPNDRPEIDPQLKVAVLVMRAQLLNDQYAHIAMQSTDDKTLPGDAKIRGEAGMRTEAVIEK